MIRIHLRELFVIAQSMKGSSDAEKRFQPAARRVFFGYRDAGTSRHAGVQGAMAEGM
jgi:hypothetical protein